MKIFLVVFALSLSLPVLAEPETSSDLPFSGVSTESGLTSGGTDVGGGGVGALATWRSLAAKLEEDVRRLVVSKLSEADLKTIKKKLPKLIRKAKIEFVPRRLFLGRETPEGLQAGEERADLEREAINFPTALKVRVNQTKFESYDSRSESLLRLVLHEYLGLMGISETDQGRTHYRVSNTLIEDFKGIKKVDTTGTQIEWIENCEQFLRIGASSDPEAYSRDPEADPPDTTWKLAHDIDCSKNGAYRGFSPIEVTGHIDGNGYKVKNITLEEFAPFYSICPQCVVTSLSFENIKVNGKAGFAYKNEGTISQCRIQGQVDIRQALTARQRANTKGLVDWISGGFVAWNVGTILNSIADVQIRYQGMPLPQFSWLGGFVGLNHGQIVKSMTRAQIQAQNVALFGGFTADNEGTVFGSRAQVQADLKDVFVVGGLSGMNRTRIENSLVEGAIRIHTGELIEMEQAAFYGYEKTLGYFADIAHSKAYGIGGIIGAISPFRAGSRDLVYPKRPFSLRGSRANVSICGRTQFLTESHYSNETLRVKNPDGEFDVALGYVPEFVISEPKPIVGRRSGAIGSDPAAYQGTQGATDLSGDCPSR